MTNTIRLLLVTAVGLGIPAVSHGNQLQRDYVKTQRQSPSPSQSVIDPARRLRIGWERKTEHREALDRRLAFVQAEIDRTMDADTVKRLNAEYARLQRELDERDMAKVQAVSESLEGR